MPIRGRVSRILALPALVALLGSPLHAAMAKGDLAATVHFDIAPQQLPSAVLQYSIQSGVQVTSPAELLTGRRSSGVKGTLPAGAALTQLLSGTNLEYDVVDATTVAIRSMHGATTQAGNAVRTRYADAAGEVGQSPEQVASDANLPATSAPADAAAKADERSTLQEVVVTAQKRSENILTVPISITAVGQSTLDQRGAKDINDLSRLVPGLSLITPPTSGTPQSTGVRVVSIRGISATAGSATTGVYLDETPIQGRESGSLYPELFDLERVEVLRGPQGTLFGAGSEGGTVRFITPTPNLERFSARARAEMSFTDGGDPSFESGAAAGGPLLQDRVGFRASVWARRDGGYIDRYNFFTNDVLARDTNGINSYNGRLALLLKATDSLSITPSIYYQRVERADSDVWWSTAGTYKSLYNIPQPTREEFYLPSLSIEYAFTGFSVKSISSFYGRNQQGINRFFHSSKQQLFYPAVPNYSLSDHIDRSQNNFTQELRFTSDSDSALSWVAGVFFTDDRESYREAEVEPLANELWLAVTGLDIKDFFGVPLIDGDISYRDFRRDREKETAAFADVSYKLTSNLKLSAGVRVSHTQFSFDETSDGAFGVDANLNPLVTSGSSKEKPVTPKASLSYETGSGVLYASARRGYRIGGANQLLPNICQQQLESLGVHGTAPPYTSDTVWSYEVGAKHSFNDSHLQLAASAFRINWTRIQGVIPLNSCAYTYVGNFGSAVSQGGDLQILFSPLPELELNGSVAYTDAHYTATVPVPGDATQLLVKNGDELLNTPRWQGDMGVIYTHSVGNGVEAYARSDVSYTGRYFRTYSQGVNGYIGAIRDGESLTDVSMRAGMRANGFDVSAFVNNLTNNSTPLFQDVGTVAGTYGARAIRNISLRPRTVGVELTYRY